MADRQDERIQQTLEEKQLRLRQIEAQYLRTKEFLKSSEWAVRRDQIIINIARVLASYDPILKPAQDATTAVFVLGKLKQILLEIQEISDIITEYDSLKKQLEQYYEQHGAKT